MSTINYYYFIIKIMCQVTVFVGDIWGLE